MICGKNVYMNKNYNLIIKLFISTESFLFCIYAEIIFLQ